MKDDFILTKVLKLIYNRYINENDNPFNVFRSFLSQCVGETYRLLRDLTNL